MCFAEIQKSVRVLFVTEPVRQEHNDKGWTG